MSNTAFEGRATSMHGPAVRLAAVAPDDATPLPDGVARSLYVGGAGLLRIADPSGAIVTIASGPYQYHPVMVSRIYATGTTATDIVALY